MKGAKLTVKDSLGWTPLHHAARFGRMEVVQYLVDNSKSVYVTIVCQIVVYICQIRSCEWCVLYMYNWYVH